MHGITVDADLYDDKGNLIARVDENQIHVLTGETVQMSRAGSLNRLEPHSSARGVALEERTSGRIPFKRVKFFNAFTGHIEELN
jgi:hypothetical protein